MQPKPLEMVMKRGEEGLVEDSRKDFVDSSLSEASKKSFRLSSEKS